MNNKLILGIVVVVILVAGIGYFGQPGAPGSSVNSTSTPQTPIAGAPLPSNATNTQPIPQAPAGAVVTVLYTDKGFSPMTATIAKGTIVNFLNQSTRPFRPASDKHPTHTEYPTTGGCGGSTFDACQSLPKGTGWTFKFDIPGTWGYHDHLSPDFGGRIIVQ